MRSSAPLMAMAASSSGRVARSVPLNARPIGVRTDETITASRIQLTLHSHTSESLAAPYTAAFARVNPNRSSLPGQLLSAHRQARGLGLRLIFFPDLQPYKSQSALTSDMRHGTKPVRLPAIAGTAWRNSRKFPLPSADTSIPPAN